MEEAAHDQMIVAITAYNRPHYLRDTVASLLAAAEYLDEPLTVVSRVEPSPVQDDVLQTLDQPGWRTILNDVQLGHVDNIRFAFEDGFAVARETGEDFVVWLADDLILAPDALTCTAWMRDTYRDNDLVASTALHWQLSSPLPDQYTCVGLRPNIFNSQAHGTWERAWLWHLDAWEPVRSKRRRGVDPPGYEGNDQSISAKQRADGLFQAAPLLARVYSIGYEGGMHATPQTLSADNPKLFAGDLDVRDEPFRKAEEADLVQVREAWEPYETLLASQ